MLTDLTVNTLRTLLICLTGLSLQTTVAHCLDMMTTYCRSLWQLCSGNNANECSLFLLLKITLNKFSCYYTINDFVYLLCIRFNLCTNEKQISKYNQHVNVYSYVYICTIRHVFSVWFFIMIMLKHWHFGGSFGGSFGSKNVLYLAFNLEYRFVVVVFSATVKKNYITFPFCCRYTDHIIVHMQYTLT